MPIKDNSFDMYTLRRRCKKMLKAKFGKTMKLGDFDRIWFMYFKYAIQIPLLKHGKVQIDDNFSIEIVGERLENKESMLGLLEKGLNVNGIVKPAVKFNPNRQGIVYRIELKDRNYKGQLIFEANPKLKKAVHNELLNTSTYYRILR